ncbi:MAG: hypothetical protein HY807_05370 [Nitrospirae bacterium]|nr:hypothetical protein [Nitrospirota bacterium]
MIVKLREHFSKYEPAVDPRLLILLSGLVWGIVGVMLCHLAIGWLSQTTGDIAGYFAVSGAVISLLIHHFGFLKLADKNIERIAAYKGKVCIFAFQERKSYMIILVMVCMGIILRHSPMPKAYLSIIYIGFGGAMMLSSVRYFHVFFKLLFKKNNSIGNL